MKVETPKSSNHMQYLKENPQRTQALRMKLKEISTKEKEKVVMKDASTAEANGTWQEIAHLVEEIKEKDQTDSERASQKENMDMVVDIGKEKENQASDLGAKEDLEKERAKADLEKAAKEKGSLAFGTATRGRKVWTLMEQWPTLPRRQRGQSTNTKSSASVHFATDDKTERYFIHTSSEEEDFSWKKRSAAASSSSHGADGEGEGDRQPMPRSHSTAFQLCHVPCQGDDREQGELLQCSRSSTTWTSP